MASFTDVISVPYRRRLNDKSNIARNFRLLCGIIAIGDSFNAAGRSSLIVFHGTICANPWPDLSTASFHRSAEAAGSVADLCGPLSRAASICSLVHGAPQSTGHPLVAYSCSNGKAGCRQAGPVGHIRPRILDLPMRASISTGKVSSIGIVVFLVGSVFFFTAGSGISFHSSFVVPVVSYGVTRSAGVVQVVCLG
eukprot:scaffold47192_cov30-Attheya_sp.AAC.2